MTTELIRLHNMLRQFANRESDFLEWGGTEPNFYISIQRTREHCVLEIFFYPENGTEDYEDVKLFRKNATDEDIQSLIDFCTVNISRYPVRKREEIKGGKGTHARKIKDMANGKREILVKVVTTPNKKGAN